MQTKTTTTKNWLYTEMDPLPCVCVCVCVSQVKTVTNLHCRCHHSDFFLLWSEFYKFRKAIISESKTDLPDTQVDFGCNLPFSACLWRVLFCISTAHDPYCYFWSMEKVVALYVLLTARNSNSFNICLPGSFSFIVWSPFFTIKQCMSWTVNQLLLVYAIWWIVICPDVNFMVDWALNIKNQTITHGLCFLSVSLPSSSSLSQSIVIVRI